MQFENLSRGYFVKRDNRFRTTADPLFAATLREAIQTGVEVRAFTCRVSLTGISLANPVPGAVT